MSPTAITPEKFSTFGELLKYLRRQARITQRELAIAVGYSDTQISRMEQNQRIPDPATITALFVPALYIEQESKWVTRLIELANSARLNVRSEGTGVGGKETPHNLPIQLTSFIGREKEIAEVCDLVKAHRLVTLTGSGGTGKTRLALQVASELLASFLDGVWLVELATISDPALVPFTLANLFGLRESGESKLSITELLLECFRSRKALIIFDNCEHLIEATARLVDLLLQSCKDLYILASSREALGVRGELTYRVPSLNIPESTSDMNILMASESARLFVERALDISPSFSLTPNNAFTVALICRRLDGIPLALELAAARVNMMTVEEIAKRLDDRFRLLTGGARTALPRQQTLRAMIDWSYNLLSEQEKTLFRRLAVFVGGWTLEAAEEVCVGQDDILSPDVLDLLTQLVNKSLVFVMEHSHSGETRYRMLETIRQYAREKLLEADGSEFVRDRHLAYFVKLAECAEPELYHSNQVFWLNKLDDELDNIRMAVEWTLASDIEAGLRLVVSLQLFWEARGFYREICDWLARFLERYQKEDVLRVRAQILYGDCIALQGALTQARGIAEQSLQLSRAIADKQAEALSLWLLGVVISVQGNQREGIPIVEQSLAVFQSLGDTFRQAETTWWLSINLDDLKRSKAFVSESLRLHRELGHLLGIADCLNELALRTIWEGGSSLSAPLLEEAHTIYRQLGNKLGEATVLENYGALAYWQGDYQQAYAYYKESYESHENVGNYYLVAWAGVNMAYALLRQGDISRAKEMFELGIQRSYKSKGIDLVIYAVEGLASLNVNQGQPIRAARLFAWANAMRDKLGDRNPPVEQASIERDLEIIHSKVDDAEFENLSAEGRAMTTEQAIALALEEKS